MFETFSFFFLFLPFFFSLYIFAPREIFLIFFSLNFTLFWLNTLNMNVLCTKHFDPLKTQAQIDCLIFTKCPQGFRYIQPPQVFCVWHELNSIQFILEWGNIGVVLKTELMHSEKKPLRVLRMLAFHVVMSYNVFGLLNSCCWLSLDEILFYAGF